jgi:UDP-glucose 4-epimerase
MTRILLLGGFGFIGTNILNYIDNNFPDKYSVIVIDRISSNLIKKDYKCVEKVFAGDFSDNIFIESIFGLFHFDYVIHLISSTVPASSDNIVFDIESNLIPTIHLLNIMKKNKVFNIIYLSSGGAIYGECNDKVAHREEDDLQPVSSYGIVKSTVEKYLFHFQKLHDIKPLVLRLSNPYGPFHYSMKQGIINVALRKALNKEPLIVYGDGEAKKDYIYINDFCIILFSLMDMDIFNEVFNVGSGEVLSLNHILLKIKTQLTDLKWENKPANKYDVLYFELNTSKLKKVIGDFSFTSFEDGLLKTIEWLRET